jgi:hypothetical protein
VGWRCTIWSGSIRGDLCQPSSITVENAHKALKGDSPPGRAGVRPAGPTPRIFEPIGQISRTPSTKPRHAILAQTSSIHVSNHTFKAACAKFGFAKEMPFCCGWRYVSDGLRQFAGVKPIAPFVALPFYDICGSATVQSVDHCCLEQANHRVGQRVVMAVTDCSHTGLQARVSQSFCVFDRQLLAAPVVEMAQAAAGLRR